MAGGDGLRYALAWSGGKDSLHALHRAVQRGFGVTHLFNIYEGSSGRVRFHGVRRELIVDQADALGLELIQESTHPGDFERAFSRVLERLDEVGIHGVVFGNIHLEDIREWYETRTRDRGFEHVEPLWGEDPMRLVRGFLALGYRALVVAVDLERGKGEWIGRELTPQLVKWMTGSEAVDPCGERGEYHTFAWDGPRFRRAVQFRRGDTVEREGHRFLDLLPAGEPAGEPAEDDGNGRGPDPGAPDA